MMLNPESLQAVGLFPATSFDTMPDRGLPVTAEEDILDRSKSDTFAKLFAIVQCTWLIVQSIAQAAAGLPLTELELITLAFILNAVVMYGFGWLKPFDVQRSTVLIVPESKYHDILEAGLKSLSPRDPDDRAKNTRWVEIIRYIFDIGDIEDRTLRLENVLFNLTAAVFSGLHVVAWNWDFPSPTIQLRWRIFSLTATACLYCSSRYSIPS